MKIRPYLLSDVTYVKKFTDQEIGLGYFTIDELIENQKKSVTANHEITSFVLIDEQTGSVEGLRLAYPPKNWDHGKGTKMRSDLWPFTLDSAAYFQSLFLSKKAQGKNWGPQLSNHSIEVFRKIKAKGIITHCWKESPNNGSFKYLTKLGFLPIIEHPNYWIDIDYVCTRDGKPCRCTAIEMYLTL